MEVGLAAQSPGFILAARLGHREGEVCAGYRPSHAEAFVSRSPRSRMRVLFALAQIAKVARNFGAGCAACCACIVYKSERICFA